MAYTVKQVAAISGVSVRTLHFYDELGLLKPAYRGANGYRYYEQPQLLILQQVLFYRELGFELRQVQRILRRADFEKVAALLSHRQGLEKDLARTLRLIETIDQTIQHLKGKRKMKNQEIFAGFSVAAGGDRFGEHIRLNGHSPSNCKLSGRDTAGAMCIFEITGKTGGPRHLHHHQDEWIYVLAGEIDFQVGEKQFRAGPGESVFLPRMVPHVWGCDSQEPSTIINMYQPAGKMEEFFREVGKFNGKPNIYEVLSLEEFQRLFQAHGMDLLGPPLVGEWQADQQGRIKRTA